MSLQQRFAGLIEPDDPAFRSAPPMVRKRYYEAAGALVLEQLAKQLGRGIGHNGRAMRPRIEAVLPDGADGPVMEPHYDDSRVITLADWMATDHSLTLFWHSGSGHRISRRLRKAGKPSPPFGQILQWHADGEVWYGTVRDVRLSKANTLVVKQRLRPVWARLKPKTARKEQRKETATGAKRWQDMEVAKTLPKRIKGPTLLDQAALKSKPFPPPKQPPPPRKPKPKPAPPPPPPKPVAAPARQEPQAPPQSPPGQVSRTELLEVIGPEARELARRKPALLARRREIEAESRVLTAKINAGTNTVAEDNRWLTLQAEDKEISRQLRGGLDKADLDRRDAAIRTALEALVRRQQSASTTTGTFHGMSTSETFRSVAFEGLRYHFAEGQSVPVSLIDTLRGVALHHIAIPAQLARHTGDVYLTTQANRDNAHWAAKYNRPGFKATATGGDGGIVVYNGDAIGFGSLTHEMGHNLAAATYGNTDPAPGSQFAQAMASSEPAVSSYGAVAPAEDFAEAVREFVSDGTTMRVQYPLRYAAIEALLGPQP